MATLIGLCLRVKLMQALPARFKVRLCVHSYQQPPPMQQQVDVRITEGGHSSEASVNKQLADKERVAAALENPNLRNMVDKCLLGE